MMRTMIAGLALTTVCAGCEVMDDNFSSPQEFIGSDTLLENSNYFVVEREYEEVGWSDVTHTLKYYVSNKKDQIICVRLVDNQPQQHTFRFYFNPWVVLKPYESNRQLAEARTFMNSSRRYPEGLKANAWILPASNQTEVTPQDCANFSD